MSLIFENKVFKFFQRMLEAIVIIVLGLYVGFLFIQKFWGNGSIFGYHIFTVATGSMVPVYNVNDVILVKDVTMDELKVEDDITYTGTRGGMEGLIVTHRIIKIDKDDNGNDRIFTQGVANEEADPSIEFSQVVGKVQGKVFFISDLNHVINNNYGFFFLVFFPLVLVVFLEVLETINDMKNDKKEKNEIENDVNRADKIDNIDNSISTNSDISDTMDMKEKDSTTNSGEVVADDEEVI